MPGEHQRTALEHEIVAVAHFSQWQLRELRRPAGLVVIGQQPDNRAREVHHKHAELSVVKNGRAEVLSLGRFYRLHDPALRVFDEYEAVLPHGVSAPEQLLSLVQVAAGVVAAPVPAGAVLHPRKAVNAVRFYNFHVSTSI